MDRERFRLIMYFMGACVDNAEHISSTIGITINLKTNLSQMIALSNVSSGKDK